jgi:hypothetical protein
VLTAQRDLAQAQSNTVAALDNYEKSKVQLDLSTGLTLTHNGIEMADAEKGKVQTLPHVPGIVPRQPSQELQMEQEPQSGVPQTPPIGPQPQGTTEPQAQPQTAAPGTAAPSGAQPVQPQTTPPQPQPQPQPQK